MSKNSEDTFTPFNMDEEYEGGYFDKTGEFHFSKEKSRKKMTKDDHIYGMWNEGYDDSSHLALGSQKTKTKLYESEPIQFETSKPTSKNYFNFVKSEKLLYDPTGNQVKVKLSGSAQEEIKKTQGKDKKKVSFDEDQNKEHIFSKNEVIEEEDDTILSDVSIENERDEEHNKQGHEKRRKPKSLEEDFGEDDDGEAIIQNKDIDKEILRRMKLFDFKKGSKEKIKSYDLPTSFSNRPRKTEIISKEPEPVSIHESREMEDKYGKGFKMMQKIGFELGKGLGRHKQGIIKPLQAVKMTMLTGEGRVNKEVQELYGKNKKSHVEITEENDMKGKKLVSERRETRDDKFWKKTKIHMRETSRRKHVTAGDLKLEDTELVKPIVEQRVIDMRGPSIVYYDDYSSMKENKMKKSDIASNLFANVATTSTSYMGDMVLTLTSELDKTRYNIQLNERKMKIENDKMVNYNYEKETYQNDENRLTQELDNMNNMKEHLTNINNNLDNMSTLEVIQISKILFLTMPTEYVDYQLEKYMMSYIIKKLQKDYQTWDIDTTTMNLNYDIFEEIKEQVIEVLKVKENMKYQSYMDQDDSQTTTYDKVELDEIMSQLINDTWAIPVRSYILNQWEPKEPFLLIDMLEMWRSLIPKSIMESFYDKIIFPKLQKAVDDWNPTQDRMMVHIWLHPWFPLLGEKRMLGLWKPIQYKISIVLQQWQASDRSALLLLTPWLKVFEPKTWENLILRLVLPKLMFALKDLQINPKNQNVDPVKWLLEWADFVPQEHLVSLLESYIFKKMNETLNKWFDMEGANHNEMIIWLNGWRNLLGKKVTDLTAIKHNFEIMVNKLLKKKEN